MAVCSNKGDIGINGKVWGDVLIFGSDTTIVILCRVRGDKVAQEYYYF